MTSDPESGLQLKHTQINVTQSNYVLQSTIVCLSPALKQYCLWHPAPFTLLTVWQKQGLCRLKEAAATDTAVYSVGLGHIFKKGKEKRVGLHSFVFLLLRSKIILHRLLFFFFCRVSIK